MKLSKRTLDVLKNFAAINENILIKGGTNEFRTIAEGNTILAHATVEEEFPVDVSFYNLNRFLALLDKNDPEVTFTDEAAIIETKYGRDTLRYQDPKLLLLPPEPEVIAKVDGLKRVVTFDLEREQLAQLLSRSNIMSVSDVLVTAEDGKLVLRAIDKNKPESSDKTDIILGDYDSDFEFRFYVSRDHLKMLPDTYSVAVAKEGHMRFSSKNHKLTYDVAGGSKGTYFRAA